MKIKIIKSKYYVENDKRNRRSSKKYASEGTEVYAVSPPTGPDSVESLYDEALAAPGVISEVIKGDREEKRRRIHHSVFWPEKSPISR